ncbi:MAG: acetyl-CoA carboxylase biotin carboxylase subunit [Deltaproteobacteria bacterium]|nr:acetyl-CoA carboxylase biotin carboxylase subunit [Deltaproteobacteria bacterium]
MFEKLLIANRGEIALRVIRAARELGIPTVAIHSTADADSLHVRLADESICVGPASVQQSYLNVPSIMSAAEVIGADAIHPGYGFLSENASFAGVCETCGIAFIGPTAANIRLLGNKIEARAAARRAGMPLLPGSDGALENPRQAAKLVQEIGLPVILKAAAGGGGRGMKIIRDTQNLERALEAAASEAAASFGDGSLFLERYIDEPHHIEIQVVADQHGNAVHLGERECSVQRRHQKLIEESPSPALDDGLRQRMGQAAVRLLESVGYRSLGTVEMLLDDQGCFYFMEVNTRIQVEHPVTEAVTGIDLVQLQLRLAAGEKLPFAQDAVRLRGHAIECRVMAEDPNNFAPSPGTITAYHEPGGFGVRVDSAVCEHFKVLPAYDSLLAKLIARGETRPQAIARMQRALHEYIIEGVRTTIPFHQRALDSKLFASGDYNTTFVQKLRESEAKANGKKQASAADAQ